MQSSVKYLLFLLMAVILGVTGTDALAEQVSLRSHMVDSLGPGPGPAHTITSSTGNDGWTWMSLDDAKLLKSMPAHWQLLIDQTRFSRIAVVIATGDGVQHQVEWGEYELAGFSTPGGLLRFPVAWPGNQIRGLKIGFRDIDHLSLMRKVSAMDMDAYAALRAKWLFVIGIFSGLLSSAFIYNLFISIGGGKYFKRWYMAWCAAALVYGLVWTSAASLLMPWLVGPIAVRIAYALVGAVVGLANLFLLSVLPTETVPLRLRKFVRLFAIASIVLGVAAADEHLLNAIVMDKLLNISMTLAVVSTLISLLFAARRGSRVTLLLFLGWTPVFLVFGARLARNFGILPQSDTIDYFTFISMGIESLMFSLAIANRFRVLKMERDKAADEIKAMRFETDTLRRAAHTDFLTGLGNRAAFNERMLQLLERTSPFKLFLIDIDHMKEMNDSHGHAAGDALLQFIAWRLASLASTHVYVKRIGGDEFAVLVTQDHLSELRLSTVLKSLQQCIWKYSELSTTISISVGVASSIYANSIKKLFKYADLALYEAKRRGRGRIYSFNAELKERIDRRTELVSAAKNGLTRNEFCLFYQPIVELASRQCIGAEALLRWNHPDLGLLTPTAFLELFDHNEIGPALQKRVFTLALNELKRRRSDPVSLAVNFTAMDLRGVVSAQRLLRLLAAEGINPRSLCIEVTEGVLLGRASDEPLMALNLLHKGGVRIALDDFGTGYASLLHLLQVPFDILKIDRSFIGGLAKGTGESEQIVKAVIAMGQGLGKKVVAEGVETEEQSKYLNRLGCDMGQGYLFGRPVPFPPWQESKTAYAVVKAVA